MLSNGKCLTGELSVSSCGERDSMTMMIGIDMKGRNLF